MSHHLSESQVLDGYRLIRFLGQGGFGEVWLCRSEAMGDLRALKLISSSTPKHLEKEFESLQHYRNATANLLSPHLIPIEHVNRNDTGLYYVMPLADGAISGETSDPCNADWHPLSLATKIHDQQQQPEWFSSREIIDLIHPILLALQTLSDTGLVHRDVKPDNILFFNGQPCLGDISLLGADAAVMTRRGTPGYSSPSWYIGGHPDMYGVATTLYSLLTGNAPDKMGRSAFRWPPQGEDSLSVTERGKWKQLHHIIARATEEKVSERFVDFSVMATHLRGSSNESKNTQPPNTAILTKRMTIITAAIVLIILTAIATTFSLRTHKKQLGEDEGDISKPERKTETTTSDTTNKPAQPSEETKQPPELTALTEEQKADYRALAGMIEGYMGDGNYTNVLATVDMLYSTYPRSRVQPGYSIARAMALQKLGRIKEAKAELKKEVHLSPQIAPIATRKKMWEEFGDLESAEYDITRILKTFGPNTFILFLRADIRAQRNNFPGVLADRNTAYKLNPKEPEQRRLVDTMWAPLKTKYPEYGEYLEKL